MIRFPLVIADSERDMPGIEPGLLGWHTSALTTDLQEVRYETDRQHKTYRRGHYVLNNNSALTTLTPFGGTTP